MLMPHHVSSRIQGTLEQVIAPAAKRLSLERTLGGEPSNEAVAIAVTTVLFGSSEAPDDVQPSEGGGGSERRGGRSV